MTTKICKSDMAEKERFPKMRTRFESGITPGPGVVPRRLAGEMGSASRRTTHAGRMRSPSHSEGSSPLFTTFGDTPTESLRDNFNGGMVEGLPTRIFSIELRFGFDAGLREIAKKP